jgi:MFS family permease
VSPANGANIGICRLSGARLHATTIYAYRLGPFIEPIQQEFGWTRAQVMLGLTITNLPQILLLPLIGQLVDSWGPGRVGHIGVITVPSAIALLGTATGSNTNWWAIWALIALTVPFAQGSVWTTPVVGRFVAGRGMTLAVTLSGPSIASAVMPMIATVAVAEYGWRHGISVFAGAWLLLLLVPVALFFRGPQDRGRVRSMSEARAASDQAPGLDLAEALRGLSLYKLIFVAFTYTFVLIATVIHLIPMLKGLGAAPMHAAATAGLYGIFAVVGRLITGLLLDRFPSTIPDWWVESTGARSLGFGVCSLPIELKPS